MADEQNATPPSVVDGGEPTDQEALLAAQVDTIGDNPTEEPAPAPAPPPVTDPAQPAAPAPAPEPAAPPAEAPPAAAPPADPVLPPAPAPVAPVPPRDFDADLAALQEKYDNGDIEGSEYQAQQRAIMKEEAQFTARLEIFNERQQTAEQQAAAEFSAAALNWEKANSEFMSNPLRANQMQMAINAVAQQQPNLAPAALFEAAAKIAFEAYGYQPKAPATTAAVDAEQAIADAAAKRAPTGVPPTLAGSPAAAPIEAPPGNSAYAGLDAKDISSLEDAVARMTPDQREAYLRDAPGAGSTGIPG